MKELSAELIIRRARQPAGQHKLTEVCYGMYNFNRVFPKYCFSKILTSHWLVIAQRQHYDVIDWSDYQREKPLPYQSTMFAPVYRQNLEKQNLEIQNPEVDKIPNGQNPELDKIKSRFWLKKLASVTSPLTVLNVSGTANLLMKMLASLISEIAN